MDGVDGSGHPIPEFGGGTPPRQPWPRRGERSHPERPAAPREQPPTGRRAPVMDVPGRPVRPPRGGPAGPRQPGPRIAGPARPSRSLPPPTAPTAPVGPIDDEDPTTIHAGGLDLGKDGIELAPIPVGRQPVEPRRSVTRKPGRPPKPGKAAKSAKSKRPAAARERASDDDGTEGARGLGPALVATLAATVAPGSGHLILGRRQTGALILGAFALVVGALVVVGLNVGRAALLETVLNSRTLAIAMIAMIVGGLLWIATIVRTYLLARPSGLAVGPQAVGALAVAALCLVVAAPLGYGANLANTSRSVLNDLFPSSGGGTAAAEAIAKPRLNVLLVGSDAGPDRKGTRTDTMMLASIDTRSGRSTLFGLPRNIQRAQFPPDSPMGERFPRGFHDSSDPLSGNFLLNAVYAYGLENPDVAPAGPTDDPGLNLLHQGVAHMLGLDIDYYVEVNMAGFQSMIDALGGLTVDVGPEPIPIGGISPSGKLIKPDGYIPPGVQRLTGEQALAFARSRTGTTDYARMGRQRCLLQNLLSQKSAADVLANFQDVAAVTTDSVSTNVPQEVLPALVALAGNEGSLALESVSFDPNLPDPSTDDGQFSTANPNFEYMREVVQDAINRPAAPAPAPVPEAPSPTKDATGGAGGAPPAVDEAETAAGGQEETGAPLPSSAPTSLAAACS
ncbi:LCP family protein [Pseudonocardia humida]|uniref:LCP family protein n=1 Tax=Pseudonocardia humida TaxID=2800819 RepID=A0ABT1AD23_9PSEU|nr:LCP family protein [Pseudonocardia humida]MCO1660969.1 LCP family protein [Pseudonocardia humida]